MEIMGASIWDILWKEGAHFALSAFVGWQAYYWTLTILSHIISSARSRGCTTVPTGGVFSISRLPWLVSLSCALLAHILEDFTLNVF